MKLVDFNRDRIIPSGQSSEHVAAPSLRWFSRVTGHQSRVTKNV